MRKVKLLGIDIKVGDYGYFVSLVLNQAKRNRGFTIAPIAIHSLVLSVFNKKYKDILRTIDCVLPDSYWHLWGVRYLYKNNERTCFYGPYLMRDIMKEAKKEGINIYLYGGPNKKVLNKLVSWFDSVGKGKGKIFTYDASFSIDSKEIKKVAEKINKKGRGVLFIGLGTPLQHEILVKMKDRLNIPIIAVGAAFNLLSGEEKMAPDSWREKGFEWLFRLKESPSRMIKRYIYCTLFFPIIFIERVKKDLLHLLKKD